MRRMWTLDMVRSESEKIAKNLGHFPSSKELRVLGRNDLACQISRRGGFLKISDDIKIPRERSDSDTGWEGEFNVLKHLETLGFSCKTRKGTKCPFDMIVDDAVRIDVKSAPYCVYGYSKGWFYCIGKYVQSDIVILHQLDTKENYIFYWWEVNTSNITISLDGGKYADSKNAYWKISKMRDSIRDIRK